MQRATITGLRIRSPSDARLIFHAVCLNVLPMVTRRLDTEERSLITSGSVYVWEERGQHTELTGVGIERWTDGIRWGPSRVREGFLFYHEKPTAQQLQFADSNYDPMRTVLIKQTYTVYVDTPRGQRKWHLIAYFTEDTVHRLRSVDDIPQLGSITVPASLYKSARSAKGRPDHIFSPDSESQGFAQLEYVPYAPPQASPTSPSPSQSPIPEHSRYQSASPWPGASPPHEYHAPGTPGPSGHASTNSSEGKGKILVPLSYLEDHPPPRRHPTDEKVLMMLTSRCFHERQKWLHNVPSPKPNELTHWHSPS